MLKIKKIALACTNCLHKNYYLNKSTKQRLEIKKFCKYCNSQTLHKEEK